jgi:RecT family
MSNELLVVTSEQRDLVKKTIAPDATDAELELFFYDNKRRGVHPLDKLIHFTKRKGRYVPVTSIHFMRAKADEGGRAGQDQPVFAGNEGKDGYECLVTVYKIVGNERVPYIGVAKWKEYYPGDGEIGFMWRKMPSHMLAKCAEANALRLAFPRELAGLHVEEEVHVLDDEPRNLATETQAARQSNEDKMKALQQKESEREGAAPATPSAASEPEVSSSASGAPSSSVDSPAAPYRRTLATCEATNQAVNAWWQTVPDELKQDLYSDYTQALKDVAKQGQRK